VHFAREPRHQARPGTCARPGRPQIPDRDDPIGLVQRPDDLPPAEQTYELIEYGGAGRKLS
jgi:hypothetical protein